MIHGGITVAALAIVAVTSAPAPAMAPPADFFGVVLQEPLTAGDLVRLAEGEVGTARIPFNWAAHQEVKGKCKADAPSGVCNWLTWTSRWRP
jgi:hypothetical protein